MGLSCKGNHSTPEISGIAALCCNSLGVEITAMSDDDSPDLAHKIQLFFLHAISSFATSCSPDSF
jgi:hypothetical protein